jgi:hypothetical protein
MNGLELDGLRVEPRNSFLYNAQGKLVVHERSKNIFSTIIFFKDDEINYFPLQYYNL